ncbi:MAG: sigma-70 family RNA polymerase sigma factor [Deltaproteobacteria bacterium]|nr:sigma-70 family RNA polymerase sigma factor [Deltaproteobacteria bacterium]
MERTDLRVVHGSGEGSLEDLSDDDLMRLAKAERKEAFEVLIRRHQKLVLGFADRFFCDHSKSWDVAQDVFLCLWDERQRYEPRGRFRSYLVSMTIHRCHFIARKQKNREKKLSELTRQRQSHDEESDMPVDQLLEMERSREVREKLLALSERTRDIIILRFTQELTLDEIASVTDLPLGTVKSHIFRGLRQLSKLLAGVPK